MEYSSNAKGNAGLTTGIIGTALGALNSGVLGGVNLGGGMTCSENNYINRYELSQAQRISELETEVKLRDANFYAINEVNNLRNYVDERVIKLEKEICDQKVYNATANGAISCIQGQIAQLMGLAKLVVPNSSVCPGWTTTAG